MTGIKEHDIQSKSIVVSNSPINLGLGAVPSKMKRFITFLKHTNEHGAANALFLCSGTTATDAASAIQKDKQSLGSQYDIIAYPDNPDPEKPLFSIAGGKFLSAFTSAGKMHLFLQYFDE